MNLSLKTAFWSVLEQPKLRCWNDQAAGPAGPARQNKIMQCLPAWPACEKKSLSRLPAASRASIWARQDFYLAQREKQIMPCLLAGGWRAAGLGLKGIPYRRMP